MPVTYATQQEFDRRTRSGEWSNPLQLRERVWQVNERGTNARLTVYIK